MKNKWIILSILIALFLFFRLLILFTSEKIYIYEELYMGTVANEIIEGLSWPFFDYQQNDYQGASLLGGILIAPLFLLFGKTITVLKLCGVLVGLVTLILFYLFSYRFFGGKGAILAGLIYIFPLPPETVLNVAGGCPGFFIISITLLLIFSKIFFDVAANEKNNVYFILFGLACGFAIYIHIGYLVAVLPYLIFWFLLDKRLFFKKSFSFFIISFIIGLSPWIYYNLTHRFGALFIRNRIILDFFDPGRIIPRFIITLAKLFPSSFSLRHSNLFNQVFADYIFYAIFIFSYLLLFKIYRKNVVNLFSKAFSFKPEAGELPSHSKEVLFLLYPVLYLLILSSINFIGYGVRLYDYIPLYPFIFITISIAIIGLWVNKRYFTSLIISSILFSILVTNNLGFITNKNTISIRNKLFAPYSYELIVMSMYNKFYWRDQKRCIDYVNRIKDKYKSAAHTGIDDFFTIFYPDGKTKPGGWDKVRMKYGYESAGMN